MNEYYFYINTAAIFSLAFALFCLKKEYECFRNDVIKLLGGLSILVKNNSQGMTIHVSEKSKSRKELN